MKGTIRKPSARAKSLRKQLPWVCSRRSLVFAAPARATSLVTNGSFEETTNALANWATTRTPPAGRRQLQLPLCFRNRGHQQCSRWPIWHQPLWVPEMVRTMAAGQQP